ncbi:hypothetical protein [Rhodopseudomonas telluris]|uniref:Uncharacterized protein n=1 Tax=Rhodopseudomonas telluris TaxID=644215 RepID=A0ABV6EZI0_9BRAD
MNWNPDSALPPEIEAGGRVCGNCHANPVAQPRGRLCPSCHAEALQRKAIQNKAAVQRQRRHDRKAATTR